jgi:catechol 2,3-dioxygenase-like lactoylglutathione lyase family enzyme
VLHHVSIEVAPVDLGRMTELWRLLGFEPAEAPESLRPHVTWLERGGTQIHLIRAEQAVAPALGHAAVVAPDFEATVARLREAGFEVDDHEPLWGERRAFALAPGGHRVELMAAPPG